METKYRDIADGNYITTSRRPTVSMLETKYRDIADGNLYCVIETSYYSFLLETKYRDIADGNMVMAVILFIVFCAVGNQVPRYSGWKPHR